MKNLNYLFILLFLVTLSSCDRRKITRLDTMTSGKAMIVSDDCFSPIINEEIAVFQGLNPEASITPVYTSEMEAFNLLLKDSIRLLIAARELTVKETNSIKERKLIPRTNKIALDGIALIINNKNHDSIISVSSIGKILTGEIKYWSELYPGSTLGSLKVVFDNPNSSTVRFIKDTILHDKPFSEDIRSQESNRAVLEFVAKTPNAMGIVGVNWVCNPKDSTNLSFSNTIRVMSVSAYEDAREDNSYQPLAAWIALSKYPLIRNVYLITTDLRGGLPSGFMDFVSGDSGQRLIMKYGMVPATKPLRLVSVKSE